MLSELHHTDQLKGAGFGRPPPRHGLHLLHWFCTECLDFNNNTMVPRCSPDEGDFGFHLFKNEPDQNDIQLLPHINFPYYVVGNLNKDGAEDLPYDVRQANAGHHDDSNKDRIIVSLINDCFDKVYITEHINERDYDPNKTYLIKKKLIKYIRSKTRAEFLDQMGITASEVRINMELASAPERNERNNTAQNPPESKGFWDYCTIL